jgi:hypothetical protein
MGKAIFVPGGGGGGGGGGGESSLPITSLYSHFLLVWPIGLNGYRGTSCGVGWVMSLSIIWCRRRRFAHQLQIEVWMLENWFLLTRHCWGNGYGVLGWRSLICGDIWG